MRILLVEDDDRIAGDVERAMTARASRLRRSVGMLIANRLRSLPQRLKCFQSVTTSIGVQTPCPFTLRTHSHGLTDASAEGAIPRLRARGKLRWDSA
jgi:hypothetical protein